MSATSNRLNESDPTGVEKAGPPTIDGVQSPTDSKIERIVLQREAIERIDAWVVQVKASRPGVEITRRDLVQWLIMEREDVLDYNEVKELAAIHYNELRFLQYAIRELKAAKGRGIDMTMQEFLNQIPSLKSDAKLKRGVRKEKKLNPEATLESKAMPESLEIKFASTND